MEITEEREADLNKFILDFVRMWLVFCTQRYRTYMTLPGTLELDQAKKMKLAQANTLMLTQTPRLQRFGNSKGIELQEVSIISGCEGKAVSLKDQYTIEYQSEVFIIR